MQELECSMAAIFFHDHENKEVFYQVFGENKLPKQFRLPVRNYLVNP